MAEETSVLTLEVGADAEKAQQAIEQLGGHLETLNGHMESARRTTEEHAHASLAGRDAMHGLNGAVSEGTSVMSRALGPMGSLVTEGHNLSTSLGEAAGSMNAGLLPALGGFLGVGVAASAVFVGLGTEAGNWANEMMRLQAVTGLSQEETEKWSHAMAIAGGNANQLERASTMLYRATAEVHQWLQKGTGEAPRAAQAFHELGLGVIDAHGNMRAMGDLLPALLDKLGHMEDATRRNEIVVELFGARMGRGLIPLLDNYATVMENARKVTESQNVTMKNATAFALDYNTQLAQLKHEMDVLATDAGPAYLSFLQRVVRFTDDAFKATQLFLGVLGKEFEMLGRLPAMFQQLERTRPRLAPGAISPEGEINPALFLLPGGGVEPGEPVQRYPSRTDLTGTRYLRPGQLGAPSVIPPPPESPTYTSPPESPTYTSPPLSLGEHKKSLDELLANMTGLRDAQAEFNRLVAKGSLKEAAALYMQFGQSAEAAVAAVRSELERLAYEQERLEKEAEMLAKKTAKEAEKAAEELQKGWEKAVEANRLLQAENKKISEDSIKAILAAQVTIAEEWQSKLDKVNEDKVKADDWYQGQLKLNNKLRLAQQLLDYKEHNAAILREAEGALRTRQAQARYFEEQALSESIHKRLIALGVPEELSGVNVSGGGLLGAQQALARAESAAALHTTNGLLNAILEVLLKGHTIQVDSLTLGRTATQGTTLTALNLGRVGVGRI